MRAQTCGTLKTSRAWWTLLKNDCLPMKACLFWRNVHPLENGGRQVHHEQGSQAYRERRMDGSLRIVDETCCRFTVEVGLPSERILLALSDYHPII